MSLLPFLGPAQVRIAHGVTASGLAERSVINAMGLVAAVGASRFVPGDSSKQLGPVSSNGEPWMPSVIKAWCRPPANQLTNQDGTTMVVSLSAKNQGSTVKRVQLAPAGQSDRRQNDCADSRAQQGGSGKVPADQEMHPIHWGGECTIPFLSTAGRSNARRPSVTPTRSTRTASCA